MAYMVGVLTVGIPTPSIPYNVLPGSIFALTPSGNYRLDCPRITASAIVATRDVMYPSISERLDLDHRFVYIGEFWGSAGGQEVPLEK